MTFSLATRRTACGFSLLLLALSLVSCAHQNVAQSGAKPSAVEQPPVIEAPALGDQALAQGVQMYQAAKYDAAETLLKTAIKQGLTSNSETARAHKYLAFIYCTSKREALCAAAFKQARQSDTNFELSKAEAGHPIWGPVYRKSMLSSRSKAADQPK